MHKPSQPYRYTAFAVALMLLAAGAIRAADKPEVPSEQKLIETLRSGSKPEQAIACKQLAIYGSKAAVPELAKLLSDKELASWSRIALEAIPDQSADKALLKAASTVKGELLVGTINSIGVRRSVGAVPLLAKQLKADDAQVASAAAVALGRIGDKKASNTLRESLAGAPGPVRSAIAEGCILCAERLMAEGEKDRAAKIYDEVRKADVPKQRAREATRGAIIARGERGIPLLVEQLKSKDKQSFALGLTVARQLKGSEVVDALTQQLASAPADRAALMVIALGDRDDAHLPPAVLNAAAGGDEQVRLAAIGVVGRKGDASSIPTLLEAATDSRAELSQAAKTALAELPGSKVNAELTRRLASAKGKSLKVLIELVGQRRMNAVPELVTAMDDSDPQIRSAALTALGETVGPDELGVLIGQLTNAKNVDDATNAEKALQAACIRMHDREATAAKLAIAIDSASPSAQASMIRILGAMGGPKALATIASVVKQGNLQLVDVGTRALGEWMTVDAAPVLLDISKNSSSDKYGVRALRGYLRLARQLKLADDQRLDMCRQALAVAQRDEEKALVLDALKRCPSTESIKLASSMIDDKQLQSHAVEAAVFIAEKIKDKDPAAAKEAARKALKTNPQGKLADRARAIATP